MFKILFSVIAAIIVLWQLLLPGYVLTLDMIFGPVGTFPSYSGVNAISFPLYLFIYLLQLIISGWIVEKILMFILFFLLFWLPLKFYSMELDSPQGYYPLRGVARLRGNDKNTRIGEAYFVSILYAVNPFVYERFLAGHWALLMAYALLFPFVVCLIRFYRELTWRSILYTGLFFLLIGMFSLHILVISVFVGMTFCLTVIIKMLYLKKHQLLKTFLLRLGITALLILGISLYWIIPMLTSKDNLITTFTPAHWEAFKTTTDPFIGTVGNVAALYGFWGENEMWATHFVSPRDMGVVWIISGICLAAVLFMGLFVGLHRRSTRFITGWIALMGVCGLIFSTGIGDSIFRELNNWFFKHMPFWQGFRDSQKWSVLLILAYAFLGGIGAGYWLNKWKRNRIIHIITFVLLCSLPLLYTPTMLFGFNGQLHTVKYPKSWEQANKVLKIDPACKAIFLPWHWYYGLPFNHNLLTSNTAPKFFRCEVLISADAEIGEIGYAPNMPLEYYEVAKAVTNNNGDPDKTVRFFAKKGIRYIIYTPDIAFGDTYKYPFLKSALIKKEVETPSMVLFKI